MSTDRVVHLRGMYLTWGQELGSQGKDSWWTKQLAAEYHRHRTTPDTFFQQEIWFAPATIFLCYVMHRLYRRIISQPSYYLAKVWSRLWHRRKRRQPASERRRLRALLTSGFASSPPHFQTSPLQDRKIDQILIYLGAMNNIPLALLDQAVFSIICFKAGWLGVHARFHLYAIID